MRKNAIKEIQEEMKTSKQVSIHEGELVSGSMHPR